MFGNAYRVATVWGIPIKVHMSLIILLLFIAMRVGLSEGPLAILILLALEISIFTSIALHELGHSYVALRKGCRVREITLMFMGGVAQMDRMPSRPRDEMLMALAGPLVSVVLGLMIWVGGAYLPLGIYRFRMLFGITVEGNMVQFVGAINLFLAGLNLLPAFPMDGGRVLRAFLATKGGRLHATFVAARLGKIMAVLFGLYGYLAEQRSWILVAIAFFIYTAAGREYRAVQMEEAMKHGDGPLFWNPFAPPPPPAPEPPDEDVVISPPPYAKREREIHADVEKED
ncbi:MAG: site-2 protease family protein [Lentisphaerae bacterium]|nr:site-2 protease family protein [Lentisphaerota bacterium]